MAQTAAAANLARSVQNYQAASHGFKLYTELKDFINERGGNVLDLGIGIIIGGAFGATVTSFVSDILTPPLGLLIHGSNLENYFWVLQPGKTPNATYHSPQEAQADGAVTENIGRFLSNIINFCLICFTLFWIAYGSNLIRRHQAMIAARKKAMEDAMDPPEKQTCPWCKGIIPYGAIRCQLCTSIVNEKIPQQLMKETPGASKTGLTNGNGVSNSPATEGTLIDV